MRAIRRVLVSLSTAGKITVLLLAIVTLGAVSVTGISLLNQNDPKPLPVAVEPPYYTEKAPQFNEPAIKTIAADYTNNDQSSRAVIESTGETDIAAPPEQQSDKPAKNEGLTIEKPAERSFSDTLSRPVEAVTNLLLGLL